MKPTLTLSQKLLSITVGVSLGTVGITGIVQPELYRNHEQYVSLTQTKRAEEDKQKRIAAYSSLFNALWIPVALYNITRNPIIPKKEEKGRRT